MSFPTRRTFLQTVVALIFLPRSLRAGETSRFWFIHNGTGDSWPVTDPVAWSLENARQPIMERATGGLLKLTPADDQRIVRLVVRRCKLNLIELHPGRVAVHHWGKQGQADLRLFFKAHGLARKGVVVVLNDRKREQTTVQHGDDFLFGEPLAQDWPLEAYSHKWQRRHIEEPDDWTAAPHTWSGFGWEGVEPNRIPWAAMKCAWRRTTAPVCLNCDEPTILVNFGFPQCSMFNREARFIHVCRKCRRLFHDHSISRWKVGEWIVTNLDAAVSPDFDIFWGKASNWKLLIPS